MGQPFPEPLMHETVYWGRYFAERWRAETPTRIHSRDVAPDGAPQWHPSFERWMVRSAPPVIGRDPSSLRTTKAMRRLRKMAVREYEVLYRILMLGDSVDGVTDWLNERARRNSIPLPEGKQAHYTERDTWALFIAGVDFVRHCW